MSEPKRRMPWIKVTLVASLAANLLVVGVIGGAHLGKKGHAERHNRIGQEFLLGPYALGFKHDQLKKLGQVFGDQRGQMRQNRDVMRQGLGTAITLLRASPFDAAAFEAHLRDQAARAAEQQQMGLTVLAGQIAKMTDAERATFADRMEKGISRFTRKRDK